MPLFLTQFLGVLNDNLLKGAISFISVLWVPAEMQASVLALASGMLVAPYLMASPWAAKLAAKYSKAKVVQIAKFAEIPIMWIAALAFYQESLLLSMTALWLMGLQSAFYSPSKYGLIKDVGGSKGISYGTGVMELLTFLGVLLGMVFAGLVADMGAIHKPVLIGVFMVLATFGWWTSIRIKASEPKADKEYNLPINPLRFFAKTWKGAASMKGLRNTLIGLGAFWLIGTMLQLVLLLHLPQHYGLSASATALVISGVAVGIGLGCWSAGVFTRQRIEPGMAVAGAVGMTLFLFLMATVEMTLGWFIACSVAAAFFSGWYKVPLNAWVQLRVQGRTLGPMLGLQNMVLCGFVFAAAAIFQLGSGFTSTFGIMGICAGFAGLTAIIALVLMPAYFVRFIVFFVSRILFRVRIKGLENVPLKGGALVVANHVSYLDFMLLVATFPRQLRFVMLKDMYDKKAVHWLLRRMNMIPINARGGQNDLREFNRLCQEQINAGHVVCIFSEGTVTRTGQTLAFRKGVEHIAEGINAPIIPVHLGDVAGTPLSFRAGKRKMEGLKLSNILGRVSVNVGTPLASGASAFDIRQAVLELESQTFDARLGYSSVGEALYKGLKRPFLVHHQGNNTHSATILKRAIGLANELEPRLHRENSVAIMLPKGIDQLVLNCAMQFLGKTVIHIQPSLIPEEREHVLRKSNASLLITTRDKDYTRFAPFAREVVFIEDLESEPGWTGQLANWLDRQIFGLQRVRMRKAELNDACTIIFEAMDNHQFKAIPLTHRSMLAQLKAFHRLYDETGSRVVLSDLEYSTSFGFFLEFMLPVCKGLDYAIADQTRPLTEEFEQLQPTSLLVTQEQLENLSESGADFSNLTEVYTDTMRVSESTRQKLQNAGAHCFMSAGLNEACSVFCLNTLGFEGIDIAGKPLKQEGYAEGTVGRPLPGVALRVVNPDDLSTACAPGQMGVVMLKGATVIRNYWDHCVDLSKNFYNDWFVTPFTGYLNQQGFLVLE